MNDNDRALCAATARLLQASDRISAWGLGVTVVGAHIGFGLTQVFFAHYNGVMIYLALLIFLFAALHPLEASHHAAVRNPAD